MFSSPTNNTQTLTNMLNFSYCYGPDEEETPFAVEEAAVAVPNEDAVSASTSDEDSERKCHFHAGVEYVPMSHPFYIPRMLLTRSIADIVLAQGN